MVSDINVHQGNGRLYGKAQPSGCDTIWSRTFSVSQTHTSALGTFLGEDPPFQGGDCFINHKLVNQLSWLADQKLQLGATNQQKSLGSLFEQGRCSYISHCNTIWSRTSSVCRLTLHLCLDTSCARFYCKSSHSVNPAHHLNKMSPQQGVPCLYSLVNQYRGMENAGCSRWAYVDLNLSTNQ